MKLIVDSGSTKAAWVLINKDKHIIGKWQTMGLNPFLHTEKEVSDAILAEQLLCKYAAKIAEIHYFGAGCSSPERCQQMAAPLQKIFTNASIQIDHDLKAAVLATCGNGKGIVCILGTGSNACYYDGQHIQQSVPALGYILGDEGSGSFMGKKLLANFLYKRLPVDLSKALIEKYTSLNKEIILTNIHNKPNPKAYLASFAEFLGHHQEHLYVQKMLFNGFIEFLETHVQHYPQLPVVKVHFVGSIAHHFSTILKQAVLQKKWTIGKIIQEPIHELTQYFLEK